MDILKKIMQNRIAVSIGIVLVFILLYFMAKQRKIDKAAAEITAVSPSLMTLSFLGRSDLPRGIRNNNPGNLTRSAIPWQGKIGNDGRFEKFKSFVWGLRAMIRDMKTDINRDGQNTIRKLITEYAPENENNTSGYVTRLSILTGFGPDRPLTADYDTLRILAKNIAIVENGNPPAGQRNIGSEWITDEMFAAAWKLETA